MRHRRRITNPLLLIPALLLFVASSPARGTEPMLSIGAGNTTGVYYAAGSAIAKMFNRQRQAYGARLVTEPSEGSVANIENVMAGSVTFGIAQANFLHAAMRGEGLWAGKPQRELRAVMGLYTEAVTLVAAADAGIRSFEDLRGKRVNIGEPGSSDQLTARLVLRRAGIDPDRDLKLTEAPTYDAAELLQGNRIDAYFYTVGHPNLSVREATAGKRSVRIVGLPPELIARWAREVPYLSAETIPVDYYPALRNREAVPAIGVKAILFTRADTDEETVYRVVHEVLANIDLFRRQHPVLADLQPEEMALDLILPLHPGAESGYREAGVLP